MTDSAPHPPDVPEPAPGWPVLGTGVDLVHVPGKEHGPDGLSRRPPQPGDTPQTDDEDDYTDWVDKLYGFMHAINPAPSLPPAPICAPPSSPLLSSAQ